MNRPKELLSRRESRTIRPKYHNQQYYFLKENINFCSVEQGLGMTSLNMLSRPYNLNYIIKKKPKKVLEISEF